MHPEAQRIIGEIESAGWVVSVFHVNGIVEMHAVKLPEGEPVHIARCNDRKGADQQHEAAALLARAVGILDCQT